MSTKKLIHESKKHGKDDFSYSIYQTLIPQWLNSFPFHWHDEIEITYIICGCADFHICDRRIVASQGDILIANSKYPHGVEQHLDSQADFYSILFNLNLLKSQRLDPENLEKIEALETGTLIFPELIKKDDPLNQQLTPLLSQLIKNRRSSYTDFQLGVLGCLFLIFQTLSIYAVQDNKTVNEYRVDFSKVKTAIDAVINHYEQKISISAVARDCCMSESHFMKIFKKITGKSFNEFLIVHRLNKASQMLKDTDDRLIDIANSCGFYNQSYFSRMFFRYYALTPSQYRKLNRFPEKVNDNF